MPLNEKLRKTWKAAGYARGHGSDAVLSPPKKGIKRLYYLTSQEHALSNVVFSRVKVARFTELNDPFELFGHSSGLSNEKAVLKKNKVHLNDNKGVVCFSEDWVDPILWSHYASKHQGIALGFDIADDLVKQVNYQEQRLKKKIKTSSRKLANEITEQLIYTKFKSWSYEREWRMLVDLKLANKEGSLFFNPIDYRCQLVEVILGAMCNLDLKKVRSLVDNQHKNVVSYKARLAFRSFRIIPNGKTVP